jgi:hypothetical protein
MYEQQNMNNGRCFLVFFLCFLNLNEAFIVLGEEVFRKRKIDKEVSEKRIACKRGFL